MKRILLILLLSIGTPLYAQVQTEERLFCAVCGKQTVLKALFCPDCGHTLEKSALVSRLKDRLAKADSLGQPLFITATEISALVEDLAESNARRLGRLGNRPAREKTDVEKTFDLVFPIVFGTATVYFLNQKLH